MGDEEPEEGEIQPISLTTETAGPGLSLLKDMGHLSFNYAKLDMVGKALLDLQELHKYTSLQFVDFSDNQITDASPISKLPGLLSAKLDKNKIESIDNLSSMEQLQLLSVKENQISEVAPLQTPTLLYLNVDGNQITSLSATLSATQKLKVLEARQNKLSSTAGVDTLQDLEEAYFSNNEITELCLGAMPQLRELALNNNQLTTLGAFPGNASSVENLDLSFNQIASAKELAHLAGLSRLRTLTFAENPVTGVDGYRKHIHAILPQLETLDGEPFAEEDREPPPPIEEEEPPAE